MQVSTNVASFSFPLDHELDSTRQQELWLNNTKYEYSYRLFIKF